MLVFVDQPDTGFKEAPHLVAEPGVFLSAGAVDAQLAHELRNRVSQDQLVGASEADPDMGFMARMMALCSLPRTNPGALSTRL